MESVYVDDSPLCWATGAPDVIDTTESAEAVERQGRYVPADTAYEVWLRYWHGRSAGVGVLQL